MFSEHVAEPLFSISATQAGVERLDSQYLYIQAGRHALASENARYLTFLYVNRRVLAEFHGDAKRAVGSFKLGNGWPARKDDKLAAALDDAVLEAVIEQAQAADIATAVAALEKDEMEQVEGAVARERRGGAAAANKQAAHGAGEVRKRKRAVSAKAGTKGARKARRKEAKAA